MNWIHIPILAFQSTKRDLRGATITLKKLIKVGEKVTLLLILSKLKVGQNLIYVSSWILKEKINIEISNFEN